MAVLLANMVPVAVVPALGVLLLLLTSVLVLSRRGARVAAVKKDAEAWKQSVLEKDAEVERDFLETLVEGRSFDEAYAAYCTFRGQLLPGGNERVPFAWTVEDLDQSYRTRLTRESEEVNRRLIVPASGTAVVVVGLVLVVCAVLYEFNSGAEVPDSDPATIFHPTEAFAPTVIPLESGDTAPTTSPPVDIESVPLEPAPDSVDTPAEDPVPEDRPLADLTA